MSHPLFPVLSLINSNHLNTCNIRMNFTAAVTWHRGCSRTVAKIHKKIKRRRKKMRVFKTALGVLALTLGFGLAGSVKAESMPDKDIVEIAASAGSFKTLVAAVQAAGLVDTLKGKGPLTVFAPTDE